ncbi:MAG: protein kinase [Planctomycetota bacterium]
MGELFSESRDPQPADTLTLIAQSVDHFVEAWESADSPPSLASFIPDAEPLRTLVLTELIKVDLEYRWQHRDSPKRISEYLTEFPELRQEDTSGPAAELIYEEYHVRRQAGLEVDPRDYIEEYPSQASTLVKLLGVSGTLASDPMSYAGTAKLDSLQVGQRIDDFELLAPLGSGTFARVFLARQVSMQRWVALKVSVDSGDEPRTLAQFDHESIVRVFDQRTDEANGMRLLYMQYVPGGTLHDVIQKVKQTPVSDRTGAILWSVVQDHLEQRGEARDIQSPTAIQLSNQSWTATVASIGARLARALDYAAQRNVLHRDVKPANVLLTAEASPKLADFNTSFAGNLPGANADAHFGGSLAYMSPEQLQAFHPDRQRNADSLEPSSDQYSLAVLLWELLTGERPFPDKTLAGSQSHRLDAMIAARQQPITDDTITESIQNLSPGFLRVITKALDPDPSRRWSSANEFANQLDICQNERVEKLLHPPEGSWVHVGRRLIYASVFGLVLIPNVLASVFNYYYNHRYIVEHLKDAVSKFWTIQTSINLVAYSIGIGVLSYFSVKVSRSVHEVLSSGSDNVITCSNQKERADALVLGHITAIVCMMEWAIAGLVYPLSIQLATGSMPLEAYLHFFGSLVLSGLIAAAFPFFGVSFFCLRVAYPALLTHSQERVNDEAPLTKLARRSWNYLMMALTVPLLGIASLVLMNLDARLVMGILSVGGILGAALVFWIYREIQEDAAALINREKR